MNEMDYELARNYHRDMLNIAAKEHMARLAISEKRALRLSASDRFLFWLGNILVSSGEHLRKQTASYRFSEGHR